MTSIALALLLSQLHGSGGQPPGFNLNSPAVVTKVVCDGGAVCWKDGGVVTVIVTATGGSGSGAPTMATYITQTPDVTLSAEQALSSLGSGLLVNTTGTGVLSSYAGSTCGANQYASSTSATGALTCTQVTTAQLSGTITNAQLASTYSGVGACGANTWASTLNGNAAPTCTQPGFSNLSGSASTAQLPTVPVSKGGTNLTTVTTNQVWVGTALDTVTVKTLPSCSNATTSKLLYDNATQTFSCGVDQTGGGGGGLANVVEVDVDFGTGSDSATTVVTGQTWVTGTSKILCAPTLLATSSRAEGEEDAVIEGLVAAVHSRVAGDGFTLVVAVPLGITSGVFKFHCTGA